MVVGFSLEFSLPFPAQLICEGAGSIKRVARTIRNFIKVCQTQSADLSVFVLFFLFFYYSFLFFSTATCVLRFLHYFSTNLDEIWHVHSP